MTAKEYFTKVSESERAMRVLRQKLAHFEDLGLTITSNTSAVGGRQAGASRVEKAAIGMVDTVADLKEQINAYKKLITEAQQIIDRIPQERYRRILTLKYLCDMSFKAVSDELRYTDPRSIYRAHGWALAEAQHILDGIAPQA